MITRENYEIYVIDYLDGNLSIEDQKALMLFLDRHIDLKEEFELMSDFQMPAVNVTFEQKNELKKDLTEQNIDDSNIDEWCIAAIENDLTDTNKEIFESQLQGREEFQKIYALYRQLKLKAEDIQYPDFKPWRLPNFNLGPLAEDVDFWVIAELENDLTLQQKQRWTDFKFQISNIGAVENSYAKIKLHPEAIIYPNKEKLKHKKSRIRFLYPISGIAAAAAAFYLFLNIANFKQDTFKTFNNKVAQIEKGQNESKYIPGTSFIPPEMLNQVAKTLTYFEKSLSKPKIETKKTSAQVANNQESGGMASIEPIKKRMARINVNQENKIDTDMPVEVITADNLMGDYIADNSQSKYNEQRNKLTLFKVAQKSVSALNEKIGTDMKLEAQYNNKGEKKRVKFSNRLFTVIKTINK